MSLCGGEIVEEECTRTAEEAETKAPARKRGFYGSFDHALDGKGRLIVPNTYRKALGPVFTISLTPDTENIALYPDDVFDEWMDELNELNPLDESVRRYKSYVSKLSYRDIEPDVQGRILIPAKLRQRLLKDAVKLELSGDLGFVRIAIADQANEEDDTFEANRTVYVPDVGRQLAELRKKKGEAK